MKLKLEHWKENVRSGNTNLSFSNEEIENISYAFFTQNTGSLRMISLSMICDDIAGLFTKKILPIPQEIEQDILESADGVSEANKFTESVMNLIPLNKLLVLLYNTKAKDKIEVENKDKIEVEKLEIEQVRKEFTDRILSSIYKDYEG